GRYGRTESGSVTSMGPALRVQERRRVTEFEIPPGPHPPSGHNERQFRWFASDPRPTTVLGVRSHGESGLGVWLCVSGPVLTSRAEGPGQALVPLRSLRSDRARKDP